MDDSGLARFAVAYCSLSLVDGVSKRAPRQRLGDHARRRGQARREHLHRHRRLRPRDEIGVGDGAGEREAEAAGAGEEPLSTARADD
jgi:hypothetical protein